MGLNAHLLGLSVFAIATPRKAWKASHFPPTSELGEFSPY